MNEVVLPKNAVRALLAVWEAWENADTYDSEGQTGIYLLLGTEGGSRLDDAHETASPFIDAVRAALGCRVISDDVAVHWFPQTARAGTECFCGKTQMKPS